MKGVDEAALLALRLAMELADEGRFDEADELASLVIRGGQAGRLEAVQRAASLSGDGHSKPPLLPELPRLVDEVLFYHWDPISLNHMLVFRDDYESYAAGLIRLINEGAPRTEMYTYLDTISQAYMGQTGQHQKAVDTLLEWIDDVT